jgi:hypothetical protein
LDSDYQGEGNEWLPKRKWKTLTTPQRAKGETMETTNYEVIDLNVEEMEEVIAPGSTINHNETFTVDLEVEELEEVIAPGFGPNHNETLIADAD